jgi:hypothetical protein
LTTILRITPVLGLDLRDDCSFARRPASASATGDDSTPMVETLAKSTA